MNEPSALYESLLLLMALTSGDIGTTLLLRMVTLKRLSGCAANLCERSGMIRYAGWAQRWVVNIVVRLRNSSEAERTKQREQLENQWDEPFLLVGSATSDQLHD